jgi:hypothetical protein
MPGAAVNDLQKYIDTIFEPLDIVEVRFIWPKDVPDGGNVHSIWFDAKDLPQHIAIMTNKNKHGWGVYVGVNPRKGKNLRGDKNVLLSRYLFCDFDDKDAAVHGIYPGDGCSRSEFLYCLLSDKNLPNPDMVISSGHGLHCYWRLPEPMTDLVKWERLQQKIIDTLHSDNVIKNPERVMRLPGFINTKKKPYTDVFIVHGAHHDRLS